jgi:hypothetical protein
LENTLGKLLLFFNFLQFSQTFIKQIQKFGGFQTALILYAASAVVELLAFLQLFTSRKLQNISRTHAATSWQILAADLYQFPVNYLIHGQGIELN